MNENVLRGITLIIPSLNPDYNLTKYINELIQLGFQNIIVVNDGSERKYEGIFLELNQLPQCKVLKHAVNQGKGRALKTAFHYYLNNINEKELLSYGVVTADADGQHTSKDTYKVAESLYISRSFILGTRNFNKNNVPFKSKYGNKLTTMIFFMLYGKKINDTQTGLRGIPFSCISNLLYLNGEKFDYEINNLIYVVSNKIEITEEEIETIYIDDNRETHFDSVKDSIRIYKIMFSQFFTFVFSGLLSSVVDILSFFLLITYACRNVASPEGIVISTILARIISSLLNYMMNHKVVFKSNKGHKSTLAKYYLLCILQMALSATFVVLFTNLSGGSPTIVKVIIDTFLFFVSYRIQNRLIFGGK